MSFNLKEEIEKDHVALLVIPNETYSEHILEISRQLAKYCENTCYVSLNKIYNALVKNLEENKIEKDKFFFIDGITKSVIPNISSTNGCEYISSVSALTELSISIGRALGSNKYDCMLFDSLSTLLIYNKGTAVIGFVHDLIGKNRATNTATFYTVLEGDTESGLIRDLGMFVDKVIRLERGKS